MYNFIQGQAESEADKLREQIAYTKSILPNCGFPVEIIMRVSSILNRSERELILNDNFSGSKTLYDSVREDITICEPLTPPEAQGALFISGLIILSLSAIFAIVFGSLWYKTSK